VIQYFPGRLSQRIYERLDLEVLRIWNGSFVCGEIHEENVAAIIRIEKMVLRGGFTLPSGVIVLLFGEVDVNTHRVSLTVLTSLNDTITISDASISRVRDRFILSGELSIKSTFFSFSVSDTPEKSIDVPEVNNFDLTGEYLAFFHKNGCQNEYSPFVLTQFKKQLLIGAAGDGNRSRMTLGFFVEEQRRVLFVVQYVNDFCFFDGVLTVNGADFEIEGTWNRSGSGGKFSFMKKIAT
jgi:hypothetical protein